MVDHRPEPVVVARRVDGLHRDLVEGRALLDLLRLEARLPQRPLVAAEVEEVLVDELALGQRQQAHAACAMRRF